MNSANSNKLQHFWQQSFGTRNTKIYICVALSWGQFASTSRRELIFGGAINGGFLALRVWRAYIWRGFFSEFYVTVWNHATSHVIAEKWKNSSRNDSTSKQRFKIPCEGVLSRIDSDSIGSTNFILSDRFTVLLVWRKRFETCLDNWNVEVDVDVLRQLSNRKHTLPCTSLPFPLPNLETGRKTKKEKQEVRNCCFFWASLQAFGTNENVRIYMKK